VPAPVGAPDDDEGGAAVNNPLAGHTNSYHTYGFDEALRGIAAAGFEYVELSAVPGWTEHVQLNGTDEVRGKLAEHGLTAVSLSGHSDLTTREGLEHGIKAVRWAADYGLPIVNTAVGGHASKEESEQAFLQNIGELADAAEEAGVVVALEIHGDIMASGRKTLPLLEKIGRDSVKVNYDTANVEFYSGDKAVDDLEAVAPHLAHVHLKDTVGGKGVWNFGAIGSGSVDFTRVLEILDSAGYSGPLSVELEFEGEPWPPLEEVDEAMRRSHEHLRSLGLR
jgi:L-ribulose-5-phosphate 3-epimerase